MVSPVCVEEGDEHGRMQSEANTLGWPNDAEAGTPARGGRRGEPRTRDGAAGLTRAPPF